MIPLFIPDMPSTEELIPFLREIDRDKWYSNFGPKVSKFEQCLAKHFKVPKESVVTTSSATTGLMIGLRGILANFPQAKQFNFTCLLPAWTFVASAQAVLEAGGQPIFCDVETENGCLSPELVLNYLSDPKNVTPDVIMPVAPFGAKVNGADWDEITNKTGIPVVIDAAASFCSVETALCPVVVSLHATKVFGIGEGGVVITRDAELAAKIRQACQFGFSNGRVAISRGGNYKLSEYHAAVGLAQFNRLPLIVSRYKKKQDEYLAELQRCENLTVFPSRQENVSSTFNVFFGDKDAKYVVERLREKGIGALRWWEDVLFSNPVINVSNVGESFPVSERFYGGVVGLPFHSCMEKEDIVRVSKAIREI